MPFPKLVRELCPDVKLRKLVVNMVYVGVRRWLLGIEVAEIERALEKEFGRKPKALELNHDAVRGGLDWAQENLDEARPLPASSA